MRKRAEVIVDEAPTGPSVRVEIEREKCKGRGEIGTEGEARVKVRISEDGQWTTFPDHSMMSKA